MTYGLRWPAMVLRRPAGILFVIFTARVLLALVIIPPWQHGDEPQHMATALMLTRESADPLAAVERDIIVSMAEHRFWDYYSRPVPTPLPSRFVDTTVQRRAIADGQHYYIAAAHFGEWSGSSNVTAQLYGVRVLSALFGVLTLACCWAAARRCLPERSALIATGVIALHPQFVLVSTTATPDMVINFCGAFMWWQATRLLQQPRSLSALLGLCAAAAFAAATRRLGVLLLPIAAGLAAATFFRTFAASRRDRLVAAAALLLPFAGVLAVAVLRPEVLSSALDVMHTVLQDNGAERRTWAYVLVFTRSLFDSAWLVAGWFRFPAPGIWLWVMHALTLVAAIGTVRSLRRGGPLRGVQLTAIAFVGIMVTAVYVYHLGLMNGGALGRYLFPAAGPMSVLLWLGLRSWWPERHWGMVGVALLALMGMFDAVGWAYLMMPIYL